MLCDTLYKLQTTHTYTLLLIYICSPNSIHKRSGVLALNKLNPTNINAKVCLLLLHINTAKGIKMEFETGVDYGLE